MGLAYAYLAREDYAWARQNFERALALDPDHEDTLAGYGEVLPRYETVIFDEAHHVENVATTFFGFTFSRYQIIDLCGDVERSAETELSGKAQQAAVSAAARLIGAVERLASGFPLHKGRFLLQPVLQSVVKALFDIESDFVKVNIHMGCNAVIVMNANDIGVVFLYQTIFHSWVIGLPYLPNNFLAFLPDFLQCFILDMRFYYIPWLPVRFLSLCSDFQLKAQKLGIMAFQIYDFRFLRAGFQSQTFQKPLFRCLEQLDCI